MRLPVLLALATLAVACGPVTPPGPEPKLSVIQTRVFQQGGCLGCHFDDKSNGKLNLLVGKSFPALVGQGSRTTTWVGTPYEGKKLVEPGDPDNSLLIIALEHRTGVPETQKMPQGLNKLPADRIALVRQWIEDGALDN